MATVILNKFDGGHAQDLRTFATDQCAESLNFDNLNKPHLLQPYLDMVTESVVVGLGNIADYELNGITQTDVSGTTYFVTMGKESDVDANPTFYYKTNVTDKWTQGGVGTPGSVLNGTLTTYKGKAYMMSVVSDTYRLWQFTNVSTATSVGTLTYAGSGVIKTPRPFVHPEDNVLYMAIGNVIAKWDGTTFTSYTSILPEGYSATSLTNYGSYLAISMIHNLGIEKPKAFLWGRDSTVNTLQGVIDFREGYLNIIENIDNVLYAVITPVASLINPQLSIRAWAGGSIQDVVNIDIAGSSTLIAKSSTKEGLYFALSSDDCVYRLGKNKDGRVVLTKDRYIATGSDVTLVDIGFYGEYMFAAFGSGSFYRTTNSLSVFSSTSKYKTTLNPSMPISDRLKKKQLRAVQVSYTGVASGTVALKYSVDGSAMVSIISESTTATEEVKEATKAASAQFEAGREYQFQVETTGGVKIKEIKYSYDLLNTQI